MIRVARKLSVAAATALLVVGISGCSMGGDVIPDALKPNPGAGSTGTQGSEPTDDGKDGRAFDSTDDAVLAAVAAAMNPDDIAWDGKTLIVSFSEGSVSDPTAGIGCLAINTIIAADETGIVRFPDGDFDCETRR